MGRDVDPMAAALFAVNVALRREVHQERTRMNELYSVSAVKTSSPSKSGSMSRTNHRTTKSHGKT